MSEEKIDYKDKTNYEPYQNAFIKKADTDNWYLECFEGTLVTSLSQLEELCNVVGKNVAIDTETTGLTFFKDKVVGLSFSFTSKDGYYVPLRHQYGNLPIKETMDLIQKLVNNNKVLMFNAIFDTMMLFAEGIDFKNVDLFEVQALLFSADSNVKKRSLKWASEWYLGRKAPTFKATLGTTDEHFHFGYLLPEESVFYTTSDSANTFGLYEKLYDPLMKECGFTIKLDNALVNAMVDYYVRQPIYIDNQKMSGLSEFLKNRILELEKKVFVKLGTHVDLESNKQKAEALLRVGIDTGKKSSDKKNAQMALDKDSLDVLAKKYQKEINEYNSNPEYYDNQDKQSKKIKRVPYEIIPWLIERSTLRKQLSSYTEKLSKVDKAFISYRLFDTGTGRLSSGGSGNDYFINLNYQNLTKPKPQIYRALSENHPLYNSDIFEGCDEIMGYKFHPVMEYSEGNPMPLVDAQGNVIEGTDYFVESAKQDLNVRSAITVPDKKEWLFCSIDYSAEEILICANLSNEQKYIEPLKSGEDIHKSVAYNMFGKDNYDKSARKKAKFASFGLLYGGTYKSLMMTSKLPESDCKDIFNKYWSTMVTLKNWISRSIRIARQERDGNVYSYFGRPRRLKYYLANPIDSLRAFGERSVVSHLIQSTCADVMRIVLVQMYKQIFSNPENLKEIQFSGCVHDEINTVIRRDCFTKWHPVLKKIMEINRPDWALGLETSLELGTSYGNLYPFVITSGGKYIPKRI